MSIRRLLIEFTKALSRYVIACLEETSDNDDSQVIVPSITKAPPRPTEQQVIRGRMAVWNYAGAKTPELEQAMADYQTQIMSPNQ